MTELQSLILPIGVSAVFVFIASTVLHTVGWHKTDYPKLPDQDKILDALRPFAIPPGDYMAPRADTTAQMMTPEFDDKLKQGPVLIMTVMPNGPFSMGRNMGLWFIYSLVIAFVTAYAIFR